MALKVGSLYVSLTARTGAFIKGLDKAIEAVEKTANRVKRATKDVGQLGAGFAVGMGAAIAIASQYDSKVAAAAKRTKDAFATISVEVARALLPALQSVNNVLTTAIGWWQGLSASTRANITNWALFAAKALALVFVLHKAADAVEGFAELSAIGLKGAQAMGGLLVSIWPVVAVLGAVYAATVLVRAITGKTWSELGDVVRSFWEKLVEWAQPVFEWLAQAWEKIKGVFGRVFKAMAAVYVTFLFKLVRDMEWLMKKLGIPIDGVKEVLLGLVDFATHLDVAGGLTESFQFFGKFAGKVVDVVESDVANVGAQIDAMMKKFTSGKASLLDSDKKLKKEVDPFEGWAVKPGFSSGVGMHGSTVSDLGKSGGASAVTAATPALAVMQSFQGLIHQSSMVENAFGALQSATEMLHPMVSRVMQAFKEGGIWGAIAAIVLEVLAMSKAFNAIVDQIMKGMGMIAQVFDLVLSPVADLGKATNNVIGAIMEGLQPLFEGIRGLAGHLAPFVQLLANFGPLLGLIFSSINTTLQPIMWLLDTVFGAIYLILRTLMLAVMKIGEGVAMLWNAIAEWLSGVAQSLGFDAFDATINLDPLRSAMDALQSSTFESARAENRAADAADELTHKFNDLSESLTNVPTAWRIGAARYSAQNPYAMVPSMATGGGAVIHETIVVNVQGNVLGVEDLEEELEEIRKEKKRKKYGDRWRGKEDI